MNEGNLVQCPDGKIAIIAEKRNSVYVIIRQDDNGLPILTYQGIEALVPIVKSSQEDIFKRYYEFYTQIKSKTQRYIDNSNKLPISNTPQHFNKAVPAGAIPKRVTIHSKYGTHLGIRYVKPHAPKVKTAKRQSEVERQESQKVPIIQAWKQHLTPNKEQYDKIVGGDREVLGNYIASALWKPVAGEGWTDKNRSITSVVNDIANRLTGVRPEGFETSDIMQEVAIRLMEMQDSQKLNEVPHDKFASFVAQTVRNTSLEILRKQQIDKFAEQDINEWADKIADERIKVDGDGEAKQLSNILMTVKHAYSKLPIQQKIVVDKMLHGKSHEAIAKELRTSVDSIKGLAKRAYGYIRRSLSGKDINIPGDAKGVTTLLKKILQQELNPFMAFKARIFIRDGKLIMQKAKRYEIGEISPKTGKKKVAPGKWIPVGEQDKKDEKINDKNKKKKKKPGKKKKEDSKNSSKILAVKNAIKKLIGTMADLYTKEGTEKVAEGAKQIEAKSEAALRQKSIKKEKQIKKK